MDHEDNDMACKNCRFFILIDKEAQVGHCVRYAPKPTDRNMDETFYPSWPHVLTEYRCGEFMPLYG